VRPVPRLLVAAVLVFAACGSQPEAPSSPRLANLWVDGGDGSCRFAAKPAEYDPALACGSLREAYETSSDGGTVRVRPGRYPAEFFGGARDPVTTRNTPPAHEAAVTFVGNPDRPSEVKVHQLHTGGARITLDGLDIDSGGEDPGGTGGAGLEIDGTARDVTVRNSRIGNIECQKGALVGGDPGPPQPKTLGLVFDNVVFHDVLNSDPAAGCHNECLKVEAQAVTIRNSTFVNCATLSVSMGRGDTYGMQPYCCVVFENNVVGHNTDAGDGWHEGANFGWFVGSLDRVRIVNNTFERGVGMAAEHIGPGPYSGVIANNVGGGWACLPGITYAGNVGTKCGESDVEVTPFQSGPTETAPFGWTKDLRLTAGSPAIDAADPEYAPKTDRDGNPRAGAPDAGAYEFSE
jgi:Right handed beta helix region